MIPQQSVEHGVENKIRKLEAEVTRLQEYLAWIQKSRFDSEVVNKKVERLVIHEEKHLDELLCKIENFNECVSQKMESSIEELRCKINHQQDEIESKQEVLRKAIENIQQELGVIKSLLEDSTQKQKEEFEKFKNIHLEELRTFRDQDLRRREEENKKFENILKEIKTLMENNERKWEMEIQPEISSIKSSEGQKKASREANRTMEHLPEEPLDIGSTQGADFQAVSELNGNVSSLPRRRRSMSMPNYY